MNLNDLIHWEKFRDKGSFQAFERYTKNVFQEHSDLLDLRALNLKSRGPALTELPSDTVTSIIKALQSIRSKLEEDQEIFNAILLIKFLCILARNPSNLDDLSYSEIIKLVYYITDLAIKKLFEENKENVNIWLDFLGYAFYFLECLYDPDFSWRNWKKCIYTKSANIVKEDFIEPLPATGDLIPWFCNNLRALSNDRDLKGRLMHLFCSAIAGSQCNAQLLITPATVDAFKIEQDPTTDAIICFSYLVKQLASLNKSERQEDLEIVLPHLITSYAVKERVNNSEMTCLCELCGYSGELADCLIQAGLVEILKRCLLEQSEDICQAVCDLLKQLTHNDKSTQADGHTRSRFKLFKGYTSLLEALKTIHPVPEFLINQLFGWIVGRSFSKAQLKQSVYHVLDGDAFSVLIQWACELEMGTDHQTSSDPTDQNHLGLEILALLATLCGQSRSNLTECCSSEVLPVLADCLKRVTSFGNCSSHSDQLVERLLRLLELIGSHSVSASDMIALIALLRDEAFRSRGKRLMQILSNMAANNGSMSPSHWLEMMEQDDGVIIAADKVAEDASADSQKQLASTNCGIRIGSFGFSFHSWLCLDVLSVEERTMHQRREIFRLFTPSGNGFEAFFTQENQLIVATCISGEYLYTSVSSPLMTNRRLGEESITPGKWHMLDIVFANAKRMFSHATVTVYIDANQVFHKDLKYPKFTDSPCLFHLGGCPRPLYNSMVTNIANSLNRPRKRGGFFRESAPSNAVFIDEVQRLSGTVASLRGQMVCAAGFSEPITEPVIRSMYSRGLVDLTQLLSDDALNSKLLFYYHAKTSTTGLSPNLAAHNTPNQNLGWVTARCLKTNRFTDTINQIGNVSALFPILEQIDFMDDAALMLTTSISSDSFPPDLSASNAVMTSTTSMEEFTLIPDRKSDSELEKNALAGFFVLLRHLLLNDVNQIHLLQTQGVPTLGALLQNVDSRFLDCSVVFAVKSLIDITQGELQNQFYKFVLLDWRIWSRCDTDVRLNHAKYVVSYVREARLYFREKYDVQFFLETIRQYHCPKETEPLFHDEFQTIRVQLFSLIKFIVHKHMVHRDLHDLIRFMHGINSNILIQETIDLLTELFDKAGRQDQATMLMYEKHQVDSLYALLIKPAVSMQSKEAIIKFLHVIIMSDRVLDRYKSRLLLEEVGFSGLFTYEHFARHNYSVTTVRYLLDILKKAASKDLFGVVQFLTLFATASYQHKLVCVKLFLSLLEKSAPAVSAVAQQAAWQDILVHLFIDSPRVKDQCPASDSQSCTNKGPNEEEHHETVLNNDRDMTRSVTLMYFEDDYRPDKLEDDADCSCCDDRDPLFESTRSFGSNSFDSPFLHRGSRTSIDSQTNNNNSQTGDIDRKESSTSISSDEISRLAHKSSAPEMDSQSLNQAASKTESVLSAMSLPCTPISSPSTTLADLLKHGNRHGIVLSKSVNSINDPDGMDEEKSKDELCRMLLRCLYKIMWEGVDGHDRNAWIQRHQVFECLRDIYDRYNLIRPYYYIKQSLVEMMLDAVSKEIKTANSTSTGPLKSALSDNALELMRLTVDTICNSGGFKDAEYSIKLLELSVSLLVDHLCVWDENSSWPEMAAYGLQLLVTWTADPSPSMCSIACARLHHIVTSFQTRNYEEVAFLVARLHNNIQACDSENFFFIAPVMKTMLERHGDVLEVPTYLPKLPSYSPSFYQDFRTYANEDEWNSFLAKRVAFAVEIYETQCLNIATTEQSLRRAQTHEAMLNSRTRRRRQVAGFKHHFDKEILKLCRTWHVDEVRRQKKLNHQRANQKKAALRQWRNFKHCLTGPRGAWCEESSFTKYWRLCSKESQLRMRLKLEPNFNFDLHTEASRLRDNPQFEEISLNKSNEIDTEQPEVLQSVLGALESTVNLSEIGDDTLGDEEWLSLQQTQMQETDSNTSVAPTVNRNKVLLNESCELITLMDCFNGKLEITSTHLSFYETLSSQENKEQSELNRKEIFCNLTQLREIHLRRYNLRRSAIEIFLLDQTNYFFNFDKKTRNKVYSKILSLKLPNLIYAKSRSPADILKSSGLTQKWVNREISNFDYLIQLNTISGRTYNDLSQYPVFPWVLSNYTSEKLDLDNPDNFRDLSRPIGLANPKFINDVREKYEMFEDPTGMTHKFHYGTHYSSAAGVMHYMVRVEPFTQLHIELQSGKFDAADRQFHSISAAWQFIMEGPNDNRELIPEFFYFPEFLKNSNGFDLGQSQFTKEPVDDVKLPSWASTPEEFIFKHREALESDYVSTHLHHWIDLIFGSKQKGTAAEEALNVFFYVTYEGAVDLDSIQDSVERHAAESMIKNFGQTPCQLLKEPHPQRLSKQDFQSHFINISRPLPILLSLDILRHQGSPVATLDDPIVYICVPKNQRNTFMAIQEKPQIMVTVTKSAIVSKHDWTPNDKIGGKPFIFTPDVTLKTSGSDRSRYCLGPIQPSLTTSGQLYACSSDARYLYGGGQWDNTLKVWNLSRGKIEHSLVGHTDVVTALCIDSSGTGHLLAGSRDTTCSLWDLQTDPHQQPKQVQLIFGHSSPVTCVFLAMDMDLIVSGSDTGYVNLHTAQRGTFMHTIGPAVESRSHLHRANSMQSSGSSQQLPQSWTTAKPTSIRHIKVNQYGTCFIQWEERDTGRQHLSSYTLNAKLIQTQSLFSAKDRVTNLICINAEAVLLSSASGELIFLDAFYLHTLKTLNLNQRILDIHLTPGDSHLLTVLEDGKLIISASK